MQNRSMRAFDPPKPTLGAQLREAQDQLDELVAEAREIRSADHFDQLEERANAIGAGLRRAFRGER